MADAFGRLIAVVVADPARALGEHGARPRVSALPSLTGHGTAGGLVHEPPSQATADTSALVARLWRTVLGRAPAGCVMIDAGSGRDMRAGARARRFSRLTQGTKRAFTRLAIAVARRSGENPASARAWERRLRAMVHCRQVRLLRYRTPATDTRVALILADATRAGRQTADHGWRGVSRLVEIIDTPGDHFTCIQGKNQAAMARALDKALNRLRRAPRS